ncbi:biopolymer transporter ExbD [Isosphaeraceae bacterium EP7]
MSRRRKKSSQGDVDVPITPMLDMAFQLLTFFVLTYRPAPAEGAFSMNLLPAAPVARMDAEVAAETNEASSELPAALRTLPTTLRADSAGNLGSVTINDLQVEGMDKLAAELASILNDPTLPFDQALIKVDPKLRYAELIKVIDIYAKLKITKISFAEIDPREGMDPGVEAGGPQ